MKKIAFLIFAIAGTAAAQSTSGTGFPAVACSANIAGQIYSDTLNNLSYKCVNISGTGYVWQQGNSPVLPVVSAPSGSCTSGLPNQQVTTTGVQYSCQGGTWAAIGGSGSGTVNPSTTGKIAYYAADGTAVSGSSTVYVAPSGDTTCAADTTTLQATITASQTSGAQILLGAGNFYINALTVGAPVTVKGQGKGTVVNYCGATGTGFALAFHSRLDPSTWPSDETLFSDFTLQQKAGVTPSAGYGFSLANDGSGYLTNVHIERVTMNNLWQPIYLGTGLDANWIQNLNITNCISGVGIESNIPSPGGDMFIDGLNMTSQNTTNVCSVKIDQADTTEFTNLKLNGGAGVIFTRAAAATRIRFVNPSFEGVASTPNCLVNFGTHGGANAPSQIQFIGGNIGLAPFAFCDGATTSGGSNASWQAPNMNIYTTNYGVTWGPFIVLDNNGFGVGFSTTSAANPLYVNPLNANPNVAVKSANTGSSAANYSQFMVDGTAATGASSAAGIGWRSKVTGTQQDWTWLSGNSTTNNNMRFFDVTGGISVLEFGSGANKGIIIPFQFSAAGTALPTCAAGIKGAHAEVSDATTPTYLGTYTSGGAVVAPVMCNGTNWVTY